MISKCWFRPMDVQDLEEIMKIEIVVCDSPWKKTTFLDCMSAGYICQVLQKDSMLLGYGVISVAVGEGHIFKLSVRPDQQGQGYGKKFLWHMLEIAKKKGARIIFLEVRESNAIARKLYYGAGFYQVGVRKNYYVTRNTREDALVLAYFFN